MKKYLLIVLTILVLISISCSSESDKNKEEEKIIYSEEISKLVGSVTSGQIRSISKIMVRFNKAMISTKAKKTILV